MEEKNIDKVNIKSLLERSKSETPVFWKKIRNVMVTVGVVSGAIVASPVALPAALVTIASYGIAIGSVGAALSQLTSKK